MGLSRTKNRHNSRIFEKRGRMRDRASKLNRKRR